MTVLDEAGYTSVVATNCEQTYHRYLRHGELLALRSELAEVSGPKRPALGEGWFVTTRNTWYSGDEPVADDGLAGAEVRPRRAAGARRAAPSGLPRRSRRGRRRRCGRRTRRTPSSSGPGPGSASCASSTAAAAARCAIRPGPACLSCGATEKQGYQVAAGTGTVYSYVVHRHPPVPGKQLPIMIALVELPKACG